MSISPYINWATQTKPFTSYTTPTYPISWATGLYGSTSQSPYTTASTPSYSSPPSPYDPTGAFEQKMAAYQQMLQGQSAADLASAKAGVVRALVAGGFDFDPKEVKRQLGFGLDKKIWGSSTTQAIKEANQAGLTQSYKINQANTDANRQIINNLAARGILRSGDTGYTLGRQNTAFTQAQYGARQHILDVISGIWNGYLQAERQRQAMLLQASLASPSGGG